MITTPEQMREAAARLIESTAYTSNSDGRSLEPVSAGLVGMDMHHATIAAAIRAIPIAPQPMSTLEGVYDNMPDIPGLPDAYQPRNISAALRVLRQSPQPVAVTVKPLVWISLGKGYMANDPLFQTTAMALSSERCAEYDAERADRILSALTIHPADPLSDPRVVALVEAATKLELSNDTICGARPHWLYEHMLAAGLSDHLINLDDARGNLRAALRAIGGEA